MHANIFFFITGIAVIVCSVILCVALFHAIKVLTALRRIVSKIEAGTEIIAEDMYQMRAFFTEEGFVRRLIGTLSSSVKKAPATQSQTKTEKKRTELKIRDESN